ncbi:MAG TPA: hypothetical protein VFG86_24235 [Chloroflexota bacterium]|nr:hypothetical protein [Chloroflexota bacterium]
MTQGFLNGFTTAAPAANQLLGAMTACQPGQMRNVACASQGGASGGTATIIDVRKNGTSVYANPSNRPTLAAGRTGAFVTSLPDNRSVRPGDVLTLVCVQAGVNAPVAATVVIEEP